MDVILCENNSLYVNFFLKEQTNNHGTVFVGPPGTLPFLVAHVRAVSLP